MNNRITRLAASALLTFLMVGGSMATAQEEEKITPIKGFPDASLTIFPPTVFWAGLEERDEGERAWAAAYEQGYREDKARPFAYTLGLLLEEQGCAKFEVADTRFEFPKDKAAREKRAAAFSKFVSELELKTDYALGTEFTIHAGRGSGACHEVYLVIVDTKGYIAWEDTHRRRAGTELGCLELACGRLVPVMGLDKLPKKEMTEDKKRMLREIRAKEPPSGSERAAMTKRLKTMKQAGASARVLVYPARVGGDRTDSNCATYLSSLLNETKLCQASVAKTGPVMEGKGWPNEMQVLWLFARTVRDYVRENPADSDYVLFPDYWFNPRGQVWAVHFVVCDRTGAWVIVDLQNSHQEAFQRISPKTLEDCDRLVLDRLKMVVGASDSHEAVGQETLESGDLVMTAKDMPMEVGRRLTYSLANPSGQPIGEYGLAFVGRRTIGATTLCKQAARSGPTRIHDEWLAVGPDGFVVSDSFSAALPGNKYPLPLRVGMAYEYESNQGKVSAKVVGTEVVEVPAGKFACLAIVREREADGAKRVEKHWITPGVGIVKISEDDFVMTLARVEAPTEPKPEKDAVALSTFDTPDPLRSPLFPRAVWMALVGESGQSSAVEIDPFVGGANGTPFCLRWTYAKSGTWASLPLYLGGDGQPPVDLSKYKGVSFYIKSLFEKSCTVTIHANTTPVNRRATVSIPVQVTKEWQNIVLTPATHPSMNVIDPSHTYALSFDIPGEEDAANVIWLDEIKLLLDENKLQYSSQP